MSERMYLVELAGGTYLVSVSTSPYGSPRSTVIAEVHVKDKARLDVFVMRANQPSRKPRKKPGAST